MFKFDLARISMIGLLAALGIAQATTLVAAPRLIDVNDQRPSAGVERARYLESQRLRFLEAIQAKYISEPIAAHSDVLFPFCRSDMVYVLVGDSEGENRIPYQRALYCFSWNGTRCTKKFCLELVERSRRGTGKPHVSMLDYLEHPAFIQTSTVLLPKKTSKSIHSELARPLELIEYSYSEVPGILWIHRILPEDSYGPAPFYQSADAYDLKTPNGNYNLLKLMAVEYGLPLHRTEVMALTGQAVLPGQRPPDSSTK
ncbi:MAG: hypothetical protein JSS72_01025 [Armatimonadetes bacterium]|nr:hypothetical protein [Armatimonadota bacterium]